MGLAVSVAALARFAGCRRRAGEPVRRNHDATIRALYVRANVIYRFAGQRAGRHAGAAGHATESGCRFGRHAGWLAWPARLLLTYMLDVAHVLARIPHVFVQHLGLSLAQMLGLYVLPAGLATLLRGKTRALGYAKITDRNEVTSEGQIGEWSQQMVND